MKTTLVLLFAMACTLPLLAQEKKGPNPFAEPKNLQVVKGDDVKNLRPIMLSFRAGLGVQCTFCHVEGNFASDDNPKKNIARGMMRMVDEISTKFPQDGKRHVTCYTCHRGAEMPLTAPPAAAPAQ